MDGDTTDSNLEQRSLEERIAALEGELQSLRQKVEVSSVRNAMSIIVFSGDLDHTMAALILATGGAAMGLDVNLFFTFWGTSLLRKDCPQSPAKHFLQRAFGAMLPKTATSLPLSRMNFCGMGSKMMQRLMKIYKTPNVRELMQVAAESNVKFSVCRMSMDLMGIKEEELMKFDGVDYCYCGVAGFLEQSERGMYTLFI